MNIKVTEFDSPFSFFCLAINEQYDCSELETMIDLESSNNRLNFSNTSHGQYVAVFWNNKWVRGIVSMESQFLIWLIDYGINLRPNESLVYVNLPAQAKRLPSKVFEASIHGVMPVDKVLSVECEITNKVCSFFNKGAMEKVKKLIDQASAVYFQPIAIYSSKNNDVVLGNLFLDVPLKGILNIKDQLNSWPKFLLENKELYVQNLANLYSTRRRHRGNLSKPSLPGYDLPIIANMCNLTTYESILENVYKLNFEVQNAGICSCDNTKIKSSTQSNIHRLTPEEIEKYSHMFITIGGREYNALNIIINKTRDLIMCERYKNPDLKSAGRASSFRSLYK